MTVISSWRSGLRTAAGAVLLASFCMQTAGAADALNGKTLYLNGPVSGGAKCSTCHGASPANNTNRILAGANQPAVIANAIAANKGGMGNMFTGKFSAAELDDIAAFIGNPNVVAVPAAVLAPSTLSFSGTNLGQSTAALAATLNNSGNATLTLGSISIGGADAGDFALAGGSCANGASLAAGSSCTVQASFSPTAAGARAATLTISHNAAGGSSSLSLSGTGNSTPQPTLAISATSIDFGTLLTGASSAVISMTASNSGAAPLVWSSISLSGASAGILTLGGTCAPATPLPAGDSCTVTLQALPTAPGPLSASLALASNASNNGVGVTLNVSGTASAPAPALQAGPASVAFGLHSIGAPAVARTVRITNSGNVAISVNSLGLTGSVAFSSAGSTCGASLAVGATCAVPVSFAPTVSGLASATLVVMSNAAPLQVAISGSGTSQASATPALSDDAPLSFTDTQVGTSSAPQTISLANSGNAALRIAGLTLGGSQPGDFVLGGSCVTGASVSPGASCTLSGMLKPTATGARSAAVVLSTDGGARFGLALQGNGVAVAGGPPSLTIKPQSVDFGSATIGAAGPIRRITLSNDGSSALTLSAANFSGPFSAVADSSDCAAFPLTLAAGAHCDLVLGFKPANAGNASGTLEITSNAPGHNWRMALSGQGELGAAAAPAPSNQGGGGCSAAQDGSDPMLALLVIWAAMAMAWRRRAQSTGV